MPAEYLTYLNLILLTRLIYLVRDKPLTALGNAALTVLQCALCALTFRWHASLVAMLGCIVLFTGAGWMMERRSENPANWRLIALAGLALIPGAFFQEGGDYGYNGTITALVTVLLNRVPLVDGQLLTGQAGLLLLAGLIVANEANMAMRVFLRYCHLEPLKQGIPDGSDKAVDEQEFNAGRVIGVLERWVILWILLLSDDLGALGFIIAAKGLVRFNRFADERFAEYVLVGTLLSVLIAVAAARWVSLLRVV